MTNPNLAGLISPCPFCEGTWVEFSQPVNGAAPYMMCRACNVTGPRDAARIRDRASAIEAWNTRAALRAVSDEPGAGWKLVPVEPTIEMLSAIAHADWIGRKDLNWSDGYRIMLEAAPDPAIPAEHAGEKS